MSATLLIVVLVLVVGERAADVLERRQQEIVLKKLPLPDAHAYYQRLQKRSRRIRLLRAVTLAALLTLVYVYRHSAINRPTATPPAPAVPSNLQ